MAEEFFVASHLSKEEKYQAVEQGISSLLAGEQNLIANLANVTAVLREAFGWWWVGFYLVSGEELILGPFQGPVACTRIGYGKGVCGTAWKEERTILVPDVEAFPGHIACSSASRSEIVVPVWTGDKVVAVLDADSEHLNHFDGTDQTYLESIVTLVGKCFLSAS